MRLDIDTGKVLGRLRGNVEQAQRWLDNEVVKDSEPYVPFRKGVLTRSVYPSKNRGVGELLYNTPYARKLYYALGRAFNCATHPQACAQWFEKAKAVCLGKWTKGANRAAGGKE